MQSNNPNSTDPVVVQVSTGYLFLLERVATLHGAIAHGSDEHRAWLKKALDDHFAGRPVESPRG